MKKRTQYIVNPLAEIQYVVLPSEKPNTDFNPYPDQHTQATYDRLLKHCNRGKSLNRLPLLDSVKDIIHATDTHAKGISELFARSSTFELQIVPYPFPFLLLSVRPANPEFHTFYKRVITIDTTLEGHPIVLCMGTNGYPISVSYRGSDYVVTELLATNGTRGVNVHINATEKPYILRFSDMIKRDMDTNYLVAARQGRDLYGASLQAITQKDETLTRRL